MKNRELSRQIQRINNLFQRVSAAAGEDLDLQAHWARYLCVIISGFLENSIKEIYSAYITVSANKSVSNYAITFLSSIQNPKTKRFIETAAAFKKDWGTSLEKFANDQGRNNAIDSIMNNRHQIAHGKDVTITLARIRDYYNKSLEVVEFIEAQCNNH